jgi:ankyrin repeat protein
MDMDPTHEQTEEPFATIQRGSVDQLKAMLTADPSLIQKKDQHGFSPLMFALYLSRPEMADALTQSSLSLDLFEATALGQTWRVEQLLTQDPELVLQYSADGYTVLHLAAYFGRIETVGLLLRLGALPNAEARHASKVRPLHSACSNGHRAVAGLLLDAGADPNARQTGGYTALHTAAAKGDSALASLLAARGAELHATADDHCTPHDLAVSQGHMDLAQQLRL